MKYRVLLMYLILSGLTFCQIPVTNSHFSSAAVSGANVFSASCWAPPSVPALSSPADNYIAGRNSTWYLNPIMDWSDSTSSCPLSTGFYYYYQVFTDPLLINLAYSSGKLFTSSFPAGGTPDGVYYWQVKACDSFDHCSAWSDAWKLTVDSLNPDSTIIHPFNSNGDNRIQYTYYWTGTVDGTSSDALSGVNHVEISIYRSLLNLYWNGSGWVPGSETGTRVMATGTTSWSYQFTNTPPLGRFRIIAHAVDNAGNVENSATIEFENEEIVMPPEPTATPTPTATVTPTITPTPTVTSEPTPTPTETLEPTSMPTPTPTVVPEPNFSVSLSRTTNHLSFTTSNYPGMAINYEVLYQNSIGDQGIAGMIPATDITGGVVTRSFYLGTCSSGGVCTPDVISVGSSLSVNLNNQIKTINY